VVRARVHVIMHYVRASCPDADLDLAVIVVDVREDLHCFQPCHWCVRLICWVDGSWRAVAYWCGCLGAWSVSQ